MGRDAHEQESYVLGKVWLQWFVFWQGFWLARWRQLGMWWKRKKEGTVMRKGRKADSEANTGRVAKMGERENRGRHRRNIDFLSAGIMASKTYKAKDSCREMFPCAVLPLHFNRCSCCSQSEILIQIGSAGDIILLSVRIFNSYWECMRRHTNLN